MCRRTWFIHLQKNSLISSRLNSTEASNMHSSVTSKLILIHSFSYHYFSQSYSNILFINNTLLLTLYAHSYSSSHRSQLYFLFYHFHTSALLDRSISLPKPSHSAIVCFVHIWDFLIDRFTVYHLHWRFTEQSLFILDQLFEETRVRSNLWSANNDII